VPYPGFSRQAGFVAAIAVMVVAALVLYVVFRRKGWL
jgi:magnesium transporter